MPVCLIFLVLQLHNCLIILSFGIVTSMQYLKGLNSLRFFAAFLVLVAHAQQNLTMLAIPHATWGIFFLGADAVHFFFVLSGFLLTYLAMGEFEREGTLNIRRFFLKRILRIWPLYYLCVLLGFIVLAIAVPYASNQVTPAFGVKQTWPYYLFFLPNYVASIYHEGVGALFALWSIGVEEQFYLFFPFLMLFIIKSKRPLLFITLIAVAYTTFYYLQFYRVILIAASASAFINTLKFQFMFLGCAGAVLYRKKTAFVQAVLPYKKLTQVVLFALLGIILFVPLHFSYAVYCMLCGLLYVCIIINTFSSPVHAVNIERSWLSYLGAISYGIYMYHPYISYPLRYATIKFGWVHNLFAAAPFLYYAALLALTVVVAHLSYKYFESWFLKMKKKEDGRNVHSA